MIFRISWTPAGQRLGGFDKIKCQKFGKSLFGQIRPKILILQRPIFHRSNSVTQGLVKLLTFYFTTRGRSLSNAPSP